MTRAWHFDFYYSLLFWAALVVVALLARLAGSSARAKGWVLLACSSALLLAIPRFQPVHLLLVWAIATLSFGVSYVLGHEELGLDQARRRWVAVLGVLSVLAFLSFFKYRFLQALLLREPSEYVFLLGVSYFSFKAIHVIVDSYKRSIENVGALTFFNYMTYFPSFISGPISRYGHFAAQMSGDRRGLLKQDLGMGAERIVNGLFKKIVLVQLVQPYVLTSSAKLTASPALNAVIGLYAYAFYFYFDFSAYSDLAIGSARIIGLELPENFNWPFLQRNIRDLWTNWHMTLTSWLVDYIYWPVARKLRNLEFFRTRPVLLSVVGMNVTFIACGMWHGEPLHFVVWGAYHGLGISLLNLYQRQKRRMKSPLLRKYFASTPSRIVGSFLTFNFFAAGLALFVLDLPELRTLLATLLP